MKGTWRGNKTCPYQLREDGGLNLNCTPGHSKYQSALSAENKRRVRHYLCVYRDRVKRTSESITICQKIDHK